MATGTETNSLAKSAAKVGVHLQNSNIIPQQILPLNGITKEDMDAFCFVFGVSWECGEHGAWVWVQFRKDGELLSLEELKSLGV